MCKEHKYAIIAALLVGAAIAAPQLYFRYDQRDVYRGIEIGFDKGDEPMYLQRIREVMDGHPALGNSLWAEGKDSPYIQPFLSEVIVGSAGRLLGLNNAVFVCRFLFAAFIFMCIYLLVRSLGGGALAGIAAAATIIISSDLIDSRAILDLLAWQTASRHFLTFSHIISPLTNLTFFYLFLVLLGGFLLKEIKLCGLAAIPILGLSFYTYPYTWTFLYAFLGCLVLLNLRHRRYSEIKKITVVALGALPITLPYIWNLWRAAHHSNFTEISSRFGSVHSHKPELGLVALTGLFIFLFFAPKMECRKYNFLFALVLTPFIVLNQQILTGRVIASDHYHWYFNKPVLTLVSVIVLFYWIAKLIKSPKPRCRLAAVVFAAICLTNILNAVITQSVSYETHKDSAVAANQRYAAIFEWLNKNGQKDEVVLANRNISYLTVIFTPLNVVEHDNAHYALNSSEDELLQRKFLSYRLSGLQKEDALEHFMRDKTEISADIYGQYYRKNYGGFENIPEEKIQSIAKAYRESLEEPLENWLEKFKTAYIVWDTIEEPEWIVSQCPFIELAYQSSGIEIYKFAKAGIQ